MLAFDDPVCASPLQCTAYFCPLFTFPMSSLFFSPLLLGLRKGKKNKRRKFGRHGRFSTASLLLPLFPDSNDITAKVTVTAPLQRILTAALFYFSFPCLFHVPGSRLLSCSSVVAIQISLPTRLLPACILACWEGHTGGNGDWAWNKFWGAGSFRCFSSFFGNGLKVYADMRWAFLLFPRACERSMCVYLSVVGWRCSVWLFDRCLVVKIKMGP
ncbi:hypothetical protein BDY21DRAFT_342117 [Lineolata rhizophorae]|uniref:Uncharacterized protein n=1 Tax=Lineolata rhizophorae TaxID=578093 RepID=A0A6A6P2P5_9PEZI|nr:hypothetical protein BDY21DRAFT_342117 [Lineolata rhizophorae]